MIIANIFWVFKVAEEYLFEKKAAAVVCVRENVCKLLLFIACVGLFEDFACSCIAKCVSFYIPSEDLTHKAARARIDHSVCL